LPSLFYLPTAKWNADFYDDQDYFSGESKDVSLSLSKALLFCTVVFACGKWNADFYDDHDYFSEESKGVSLSLLKAFFLRLLSPTANGTQIFMMVMIVSMKNQRMSA